MRIVKFTNGGVTLVDDEDFEKVNSYKWYADYVDGKPYARHRMYSSPTESKLVRLHTFLMDTPKGMVVDHMNGDTLDN